MAGHFITFGDGGGAYVDYPDAYGSAVVNGKEWRWDFHDYLGPTFLKKDGEPRHCQCPTVPAVWEAFSEWLEAYEAKRKKWRATAPMWIKPVEPIEQADEIAHDLND